MEVIVEVNPNPKRCLEFDCNEEALDDGVCSEITPLAIQEADDSTQIGNGLEQHPLFAEEPDHPLFVEEPDHDGGQDDCGEADCLDVGEETDDEEIVREDIHYATPDGKRHLLSKMSGPTPPPTVGMIFISWEAIECFFRSYAKQQGFGIVRAHGSYRYWGGKSTGERRTLTWKCERFGNKDTRQRVNGKKVRNHAVSKNGVKFATRKSKKCQCPVSLYASARLEDGNWEIRRVVLDHFGHTPSPRKAKFVAMFRHDDITRPVRKRLFIDLGVGVPIPKIHRALASERNGLENTSFTQRDLRNIVARKRREKISSEGGDAA